MRDVRGLISLCPPGRQNIDIWNGSRGDSASKYLTAVVDYNACVYIVPAYHLSKVEFVFNEESNNVLLRDAVPCLTICS